MLPGSGRATMRPIVAGSLRPRPGRLRCYAWGHAGLVSGAENPAPRPTTPRCGDRAVTRRPDEEPYPSRGGPNMLRLQAPLPDDYTLATPDELDVADRGGQARRSATGS